MTISALFWNIWGHRFPADIHRRIKASSADVCCLTEVTDTINSYDSNVVVYSSTDPLELPCRINGMTQLHAQFGRECERLYHSPRYEVWECKRTGAVYNNVGFGSALLLRLGLRIVERGSVLVMDHVSDVKPRVLQYAVLHKDGKRYVVAHLHGIWIRENTKGDDPRRDMQSRLVLERLSEIARKHHTRHVIFGGDLNLDIDTHAVAILESGFDGMQLRNLVRERGITNTRTPQYRKFRRPNESQYADYVFVTPKVEVMEFSVDTGELASDHAPLRIVFK